MIHRNHIGLPGDAIIDYENPNDYTQGMSLVVCQGFYPDKPSSDFAAVAKAAKAHGSLFLGQLNHPGRQGYAAIQPNLVSASSVALGTRPSPTPLSLEDVKDVVKRFAYASEVLYRAGYDGVEVGYIKCAYVFWVFRLRLNASSFMLRMDIC